MFLTLSHTLSNNYFSFLFYGDIYMKDRNTSRECSFEVKVNSSIVSMFSNLQIIVSETDFIPVEKFDEDKFKGFSSVFEFEVDKIGKSYISTKITINL
jgi:hypothetical protein